MERQRFLLEQKYHSVHTSICKSDSDKDIFNSIADGSIMESKNNKGKLVELFKLHDIPNPSDIETIHSFRGFLYAQSYL
jgi:hypothetical protein